MAKVTIDTISRETGLSRGTVSRALNDRPDISQSTKERVLDACRKLNYLPSQAARSLATGRNLCVSIAVDELTCAHSAAILRGAAIAADNAGYAVQIMELGRDQELIPTKLHRLTAQRGDGWLIVGELAPAAAQICLEQLDGKPLALTAVTAGLDADAFAVDEREAARLALRALSASGTDVLFLLGAQASEGLRTGVQQACAELELDAARVVIPVPGDAESTVEELIGADRLSQCRGIAASNDDLAVAAMTECFAKGRTPGVDIGIIGRGNATVSRRVTPALSTIDLQGEEIGSRAMDALLGRIRGVRLSAPQTTLIAPQLVQRKTARSNAAAGENQFARPT